MRNFKNTFVILLILSLFGCTSQSISEDQAPLNITSSVLPIGPVKDDPEPSTIKVSVRFFDAYDRGVFRSMFATTLGITGWADCATDPSIETWVVEDRTQEEFTALIEAIGDYVVHPPGSAGNIGTKDPYASSPNMVTFIAPEFYFENICQ